MSSAQQKTQLKGVVGSALSFSIAAAFRQQQKPFLVIFDSKEKAAFHLNDLELILPADDVLFTPEVTEDLMKLKKQTMQMYCYAQRY